MQNALKTIVTCNDQSYHRQGPFLSKGSAMSSTSALIRTFMSLPPQHLTNAEVRAAAGRLRRAACDPPQDLLVAQRVLRLTLFLDESPGHRYLLWNHIATATIDRGEDHAVDCVVAHRRGVAPADAWRGYRFTDDDLWLAIVEIAGSSEDVTDFGLGCVAAWLNTVGSSQLSVADAVQLVFLERLLRAGVENSLPQVPEITISRGFPYHFAPGQFRAAMRVGVRALHSYTRSVIRGVEPPEWII